MRDIRFGQDITGVEWHKIVEKPSGCWEWTGKVRANGQPAHVHRILLEARTGKSFHKSKLKCGLITCVHPDHRDWYGITEREPYWVCRVDDCVKPVTSRGMCSMHSTRVRRGLDLEPPELRDFRKGVCSWKTCEEPVRSRGLCGVHYRRDREGLDMDTPIRAWFGPRECEVEGCNRIREAKGKCQVHYGRENTGKPLHDPIQERVSPRVPGDKYLTDEGYVTLVIVDPDGGLKHVREHRHVVELSIGRPLTRDETVHHINGVRDDNRLENLELWSSSHPPGQRVVDKVAWAKEILRKYESFDAGH